MTVQSPRLIVGSVVVGMAMALVWLHVPIVPAVTGAIVAGLFLYFRSGRPRA